MTRCDDWQLLGKNVIEAEYQAGNIMNDDSHVQVTVVCLGNEVL
jgi:hypothetical protein